MAVECRADDSITADLLSVIDHRSSRRALEIERAFLAELGSGCSLPIGAHDDGRTFRVHLSSDDGSRHHVADMSTASGEATSLMDRAREMARVARSAVGD